jgi:hypothetical protein
LSKYYDLIALQQKWHGMNKEDVLARVKMMIVREILSKQARIKVSELRKQ